MKKTTKVLTELPFVIDMQFATKINRLGLDQEIIKKSKNLQYELRQVNTNIQTQVKLGKDYFETDFTKVLSEEEKNVFVRAVREKGFEVYFTNVSEGKTGYNVSWGAK